MPVVLLFILTNILAARNVAAETASIQEVATDEQQPNIRSIQEKKYRLGHEFQLGLGALPLDAYYVGFTPTGSYTYHVTERFAWEVLQASYSFNIETSLKDDLYKNYGLGPVPGYDKRLQLILSSDLIYKPLVGKFALFNSYLMQSEGFFVMGLGPILKAKKFYPSVNGGLGLRLWINETMSWRIDIRDYVIYSEWFKIENTLSFLFSVTFNFSNR